MLIIFDLDDTLIDTSACITPVKFQRALRRMAEQGCLGIEEKADLELLRVLDKDSLSAKETLQKFRAIKGIAESFYLMGLKEIYDSFPEGIEIKTVEGAIQVLSELSKEATLVLVSRGKPEQQMFKMEKAGIDSSFFYKIFLSEDLDKKKYYIQAIEELGIAPSKVIVCGDRVAFDLSPAKELGCTTVHMKWGRGIQEQECKDKVDFTITSLQEVLGVVECVKLR